MTLLILAFAFALLISFACSLSEAVILSLSHAHIRWMEKKGLRSGRILRKLKAKIDRPLSAILALNTIANTLGAAVVGAQTLKLLGSEWVALVSALLTLSILVFSEVIPKTIGAAYSKSLAPFAAFLISFLIVLAYPFVILLRFVAKLVAPPGRSPDRITRQELLVLAEIGQHEGVLQEKEARIIENLLGLEQVTAKEVLTPRSVLLAFPKSLTVREVLERHNPIRFSRLPIYDQTLDNVVGLVHRFRIMETFSKGGADVKLEQIARPLHVVPQTKSVAEILDEFIQRREHIFLVVDEYGGTAGIITLEDAIETLLGMEIVDELDTTEDMRKLARQRWQDRQNPRDRPRQ